MRPGFVLLDDKNVPMARIVWVSELPHFCGSEECTVEGMYEVRIEGDDSLFCSRHDRDTTLDAMQGWFDGA